MQLAPIALFVYNRPWHTQQTVEALKKNELSKESDLFIFSDGAKTAVDAENVRRVRDYINTIDGFRSVTVEKKERNYGLANSIIGGVTTLCDKFRKVIVIEDDLVVSRYFLEYMNAALKRYEQDEKVMQISGHMFPVEIASEHDALFLPFTTSWGWATWKRAWDQFDPTMNGYEKLRKSKMLRRKFDLDGSYAYFKMLELQVKGKIDSWAIRWYLSVFMLDGLTLFPVKTLVNNIGFDGSGTHCGEGGGEMAEAVDYDFAVQKYPNARIEEKSKRAVFGYLASQSGLMRLILRRIRQWSR